MNGPDHVVQDPPHALVEVMVDELTDGLVEALDALAAEDPFFTVSIHPESGLTVIAGMSEPHIDGKIELLKQLCGLQPALGAPHVAYRETLGRPATIDRTYKRLRGPEGDFARVILGFEPGPRGSGCRFRIEAANATPFLKYLPGIEAGLDAARRRGLLAGFLVTDFVATLVDCVWHDADSSIGAFRIATELAFRELAGKAEPQLLEPVMKVEVVTPAEHMGDVIGDLNSRRGLLQATEQRGEDEVAKAIVPLSTMLGYASQLRALTQGQARFTMRYDHYAPVPQAAPDRDPCYPPAIGMRA